MNFNLMPPLQYLAAARVASILIPHPEIDAIIDIVEHMPVFGKIFDSVRYDYWKEIEVKAKDILGEIHIYGLPFPPILGMMVSRFIRPMNNEFYDWVRDHIFLADVNPKVLKSCIIWQTDGTINKIDTAKVLIRNEQINLQSRFMMACTYFLSYEISVLWQQISIHDIPVQGSNSAVRFWTWALQDGKADHWNQFVNLYFGGSDIKWFDSRIRLSCFFDLLSLNNQKFYLTQHTVHKLHLDDFVQCINKMEEPGRTRILGKYAISTLNYCLKWPYQSLFREMARRFAHAMNLREFEALFCYIVDDCMLPGLDDYNYKELLVDLWELTPSAFKEELQTHELIMKQITIVLEHEGNAKSLGEDLNKYMNKPYP